MLLSSQAGKAEAEAGQLLHNVSRQRALEPRPAVICRSPSLRKRPRGDHSANRNKHALQRPVIHIDAAERDKTQPGAKRTRSWPGTRQRLRKYRTPCPFGIYLMFPYCITSHDDEARRLENSFLTANFVSYSVFMWQIHHPPYLYPSCDIISSWDARCQAAILDRRHVQHIPPLLLDDLS